MSVVKRWAATLVENVRGEPYLAEMTEAPRTGNYVLAADYDALVNEVVELEKRNLDLIRGGETYINRAESAEAECERLREALREVQIALASDDIEYDDLRAVDRIIHAALAPKEPI